VVLCNAVGAFNWSWGVGYCADATPQLASNEKAATKNRGVYSRFFSFAVITQDKRPRVRPVPMRLLHTGVNFKVPGPSLQLDSKIAALAW
jgi:hypothetical protein